MTPSVSGVISGSRNTDVNATETEGVSRKRQKETDEAFGNE